MRPVRCVFTARAVKYENKCLHRIRTRTNAILTVYVLKSWYEFRKGTCNMNIHLSFS